MESWQPVILPDGYRYRKSRVVGSVVVVQAQGADRRDTLLIRQRGQVAFERATLKADESVQDFDFFPLAGGVVALMATRAAKGWADSRIAKLHIERLTLEVIYSASDWMTAGTAFPVALLGSSPDGQRIALACGELIPGTEPQALRYRLCYLDPSSRVLQREEDLLGLFF